MVREVPSLWHEALTGGVNRLGTSTHKKAARMSRGVSATRIKFVASVSMWLTCISLVLVRSL